MAKKINGKQILDNTIIKSINGITYSYQGLSSSNDSNVTLNLVSSGLTHSFGIGWTGTLPINRGGLNNTSFTASQVLIANTSSNSIISSGYTINDNVVTNSNLISAQKVVEYNYAFSILMGY